MAKDKDLTPLLSQMFRDARAKEDLHSILERHGIESEWLEFDDMSTLEELAETIRKDGSNTIATIFRGRGVNYKEVAYDVACKLGLASNKEWPIEKIEEGIIGAVTEKYWDKLSDEERKQINKQVEAVDPNVTVSALVSSLKGATAASLPFARPFILKITKEIVRRFAAKQGAGLAAKSVGRSVGLMIPGLNLILSGWFIADIAGPAFRKTVPTVIQLAFWRFQLSISEA